MRRLALILALLPAPALAHPHEFVEVGLTFRLDAQGMLTEIGVECRYDLFTSMLILSDLGLDPGATEVAAEAAPGLQGFDLDWLPGYNGDLWLWAGGQEVALGAPRGGPATIEGGQVVSRHARPLPQPLPPHGLVAAAFDPTFYIAYTVPAIPVVEGPGGCRARVFAPDIDAAYARLEAALAEMASGGEVDVEQDFPRVGRDFADEVRIDCQG